MPDALRGRRLLVDAEPPLQLQPALGRQLHRPRLARTAQPADAAELRQESRAKRPGEVMGSLRPVEALPGEAAARRLQGGDIEAKITEPLGARGRHLEFLFRGRNDETPLFEGARRRHAKLAGEVVIATTGEAQFAPLRAERLALDRLGRPDRRKLLQSLGDVSAGEAVIAMTALALDRDQPAVEQLGEMG